MNKFLFLFLFLPSLAWTQIGMWEFDSLSIDSCLSVWAGRIIVDTPQFEMQPETLWTRYPCKITRHLTFDLEDKPVEEIGKVDTVYCYKVKEVNWKKVVKSIRDIIELRSTLDTVNWRQLK